MHKEADPETKITNKELTKDRLNVIFVIIQIVKQKSEFLNFPQIYLILKPF